MKKKSSRKRFSKSFKHFSLSNSAHAFQLFWNTIDSLLFSAQLLAESNPFPSTRS